MNRKQPSAQHIALFEQATVLRQNGEWQEAAAIYQKLIKFFPNDPQLLAGYAITEFQLGKYQHSVTLLEKSITISPNQPNALSNLGNAWIKLQRPDKALACYEQAIDLRPDHAVAYCNRGCAQQELKQLQNALTSFDKAIRLRPDYAEAYIHRGNALKDLDRLHESLDSYDTAIDLNPNNALAFNNRGNVLKDLLKLDEALASYQTAIWLKPDFVDAYNNLGNVLKDLKRLDEALVSYQSAANLNPDLAETYFNCGLALWHLGQFEAALRQYDRAVSLKPDYHEAYINRGNVLLNLQQNEAGLQSYQQALALNPDSAETHNNCGNALKELQRLDEALAAYAQALCIKPDFAKPYNNRGLIFQELQQPDLALVNYEKAIELQPDYAGAYLNLALLKLQTGDYAEGWRYYEWRWLSAQRDQDRAFSQPLWLGEPTVSGETLLIHPEQGYGDFIQFCRYVPQLDELAANIVVETPPALIPLLSTLTGRFTLIEKGQDLPHFDLHCPVMSLPLAFKTTLNNIPASVPYLFADAEKKQLWQQRLGNSNQPRIGLVWSGSAMHKNDRHRSIPLRLLEPLLSLPFEFHSLQKDIRATDSEFLNQFDRIQLHHDSLQDFSDTAALADSMDLLISVDTSIAHLGGAMGKPVWILLAFVSDYRWMLDKSDSPWYPTATLFRQPAIGDWPSVINDLRQKLQNHFRSV